MVAARGEDEEKIGEITIESINVTNLSTNQEAVMAKGADIILIQEHKLTGLELRKVTENFKVNGYCLHCSGCEKEARKNNVGVGIAVGLFVYGKKITYAIGEKLCKITPSRGVAIELRSALVIITGSRLKIPLSTTHCQVGSTIGVGSLEDFKGCSGINWRIAYKVFLGWIITLVVVGGTTALLTAQGIYSPSEFTEECLVFNSTNMSL